MTQLFLRLPVLLLGLILLLAACGAQPAAPGGPQVAAPAAPALVNIDVTQLKQKLDQKERLLLLDVRTPDEFTNDGHVAGARLIPLQELSQRINELPKDQPIACICRSGNRSQTACQQLQQLGFTSLMNVEGGMRAWAQAGYPVEKP